MRRRNDLCCNIKLGNYRVVRRLGHGAFSQTYLGEHLFLGMLVIIKTFQGEREEPGLTTFANEARLVAHLKHPNIAQVLDVGVEGPVSFVAMAYTPNGTLRQRHPRGSRVPLSTVVSYIKQVAGALQYVHDHGIIHRDVKPDNMLLGPYDEILLSDFSIAIVYDPSSQTTQDIVGTSPYMAPEQFRGKLSFASDQYSLAVVVYEWLTGDLPFRGSSMMEMLYKHMSTPPPPLRDKVPTIPPLVEEVIMIALAKDPQRRFASMQAFANALEQASRSGMSALAPAPVPGQERKQPKTPKDTQLSLFALARVTLEESNKALIGKTYAVQAGLSQSKPENFEGAPFDLLVPDIDEPVWFDISLHTSDNIELTGEWQKYLRYDPQNTRPQLVEFPFKVIAPGSCSLTVDFYRERHLLQTISIEFDAIGQPTPATAVVEG